MDRIPITQKGFQRLCDELEALKQERPAVIQAIKEAREEGDLRENAGYDAARERQGMLEARISYLESRLPQLNVVDLSSMGGDEALFGATVEMEDVETGELKTYTLLGPDEADPAKGSISVLSPVGRALLGKQEGDEFVVEGAARQSGICCRVGAVRRSRVQIAASLFRTRLGMGAKFGVPKEKGPTAIFRKPLDLLVGMGRFERPASASRTLRSNQTEPHPDDRNTAFYAIFCNKATANSCIVKANSFPFTGNSCVSG